MRPVRDLFLEEYWEIAYRPFTESDSIVNAQGKYKFEILKSDKRFWYADPFLFEKNGKTYLFIEMFDNTTEIGVIGVSELIDGRFSKPQVILKENYHLSYPCVFEKDGDIFMMPESHNDSCIQLYKAVDFPYKWKKEKKLIDNINAVDSVFENGYLITSIVKPQSDMSVDLCVFNEDSKSCDYNPAYSNSFTKRGAGNCFTYNGCRVRPSQSCENNQYGCKLFFNKIEQCDNNGYSESVISEITPENILSDSSTITGIHTYARTEKIECVDIKSKRFNIFRLFHIIKRKLF